MALNYSHRPIFPAHLAEDNLISPMRIVNGYLVEGVPENGEGYARPWHEGFARPRHGSCEIDECIDYGRGRVDSCGSSDSVSKDIEDLLPSDPFGMGISTTLTALTVTGLLGGLEVGYGGCGTRNNVRAGNGEYDFLAGLNLIWNNAVRFQSFPANIHDGRKLNMTEQVNVYPEERDSGNALAHYGFGAAPNEGNMSSNRESSKNLGIEGKFEAAECSCDGDDGAPHEGLFFAGFGAAANERNISSNNESSKNPGIEGKFGAAECSCDGDDGATHEGLFYAGFGAAADERNISSNDESSNLGIEGKFGAAECSCDGDDGAPHEGLIFALGYLGVKDLLSVGMVCRSLQYIVRSDPLLWRSIHIEEMPLNERITDDVLLRLSSRAQGNLQCLSLLECGRITDDGVRRVLECNPRMNKLCVPGCTRISIEGILSILRSFNKGSQGIRYLRVGGLYGVTHEHFEELQLLLGVKEHPKENAHKPHFYIRGSIYTLCDDNRAIDVEVCPRCQNLRLVYDCPVEGCQAPSDSCRGCALCIARCIQCGRCISDKEYEETFCLELLCSDCLSR